MHPPFPGRQESPVTKELGGRHDQRVARVVTSVSKHHAISAGNLKGTSSAVISELALVLAKGWGVVPLPGHVIYRWKGL